MAHTTHSNSDGTAALIVTDHKADSLQVWRGSESIEFRAHPQTVIFEGSDLKALRDLLNELPEEAFVDSEPPEWLDGDTILRAYSNSEATYLLTRVGGVWRIFGDGANANWLARDVDIDATLAGGFHPHATHAVLRKQGQRV